MSKKSASSQRPVPSALVIPREQFKMALNEQLKQGHALLQGSIRTENQLRKAREKYYDWNSYNSEWLRHIFDTSENEYKQEYDQETYVTVFFSDQLMPLTEKVQAFRHDLESKISYLKRLLHRSDLLEVSPKLVKSSTDIFIVHGHDNALKNQVATTLSKLGLNPVILHEQVNAGMTIIEKLEEHINRAGFAIILLTADDKGNVRAKEELNLRARQNVILELGYCLGRLGRNKVCPILAPGVEKPSDIDGIVYVSFDEYGAWERALVKELKGAGFQVDANRLYE